MKSVPNLISYLHGFFWNFSQFLAIYFELFLSGSKFNSKNANEWGPLVSRHFRTGSACQRAVTAWLPRACAAPLARLKGAIGTMRRCLDSHPDRAARCPSRAAPSPRLARAHPDCAVVRVRSRSTLSEHATVVVRPPPPSRARPR
jgi:hypothetical protein